MIDKSILSIIGITFLMEMLKYVGMAGTVLAIIMSWEINKHIGWALLHGVLGWPYIFWTMNNHIMFAITVSTLLTSFYWQYTISFDNYSKIKEILNRRLRDDEDKE